MFNIQEQIYFDAGVMPYQFNVTESEESETFEVGDKVDGSYKKVTVTETIKRVKYYAPGIVLTIVQLMNYPKDSAYNDVRSGKFVVDSSTDIDSKIITGKNGGWYSANGMFDTFEEAMEFAEKTVNELGELASEGFIKQYTSFKNDEEINREPIEDVFGKEFADRWETACIKAKNYTRAEEKYLEKLRAVFHNHFGETRHFQNYCFEFMYFLKEINKTKEDLTAFELKLIRKLSKVTWRG